MIMSLGEVKNMGLFSKNTINSDEFEKLAKRIALLDSAVEAVKASIASLNTKIEAYRLEVISFKRKAKELTQQANEEQESINNNNILGY